MEEILREEQRKIIRIPKGHGGDPRRGAEKDL
jgi:hypothetical protein